MPLPLGHAAIGLTTHNLYSKNDSSSALWRVALFVVVLANLPDIDIVAGLLLQGNGNAFHRGPTHSLLFALLIGFLASNAYRLWSRIPKMSLTNCFLVILSHVVADLLFTAAPVSFFWPLEFNSIAGFSGWGDVINSVFLESFQDADIIMGCGAVIVLNSLIRKYSYDIKGIAHKLKVLAGQTNPGLGYQHQHATQSTQWPAGSCPRGNRILQHRVKSYSSHID